MTRRRPTRGRAGIRSRCTAWLNRAASESGSQLVELALALPVLLLLLLGMADFGFLLQAYAVVNNAAREGVRMAVVEEGEVTDAELLADVQYLVSTYITEAIPSGRGTPTTTVTSCELTVLEPGGGGWLAVGVRRVQIVYPYGYRFIGGIAGLLGSSYTTLTLTASATMRKEAAAYPTSGPNPAFPCPS